MAETELAFAPHGRVQKLSNRLRQRSQTRANSSFFIFITFFAVFGVIVFTKFMLLERPSTRAPVMFYPREHLQKAAARARVVEKQVPRPIRAPSDAVWQPVTGTRYRFYVYSAYVERRTVAAVRVVGAARTKTPDLVFCRLWFPDNRTITVGATVKIIRENWGLKFSAAFVLCLLHDSGVMPQETIGASVSVIASSTSSNAPTNHLTILDTEPLTDDTIHVCVQPLHTSFGRDNWVIEWMEFNRLLGVSHFYMYNTSTTEAFSCTLNYYVKQGLVTLMSWKMPFLSEIEIRTEGIFAAFNDCLYRSMAAAGWLLPIDIDELVLPRRERTLVQLFNSLTSNFKPGAKKPAGYLFRNTFFYLRWEDDPVAPVPLMTALKTRRKSAPSGPMVRSKYAVRPRDAVELGNHFLWEHAPGSHSVGVPPDRAVLHHYRVMEASEDRGTNCMKNAPSHVDRTAHKWSTELMRRVFAVKEELSNACY